MIREPTRSCDCAQPLGRLFIFLALAVAASTSTAQSEPIQSIQAHAYVVGAATKVVSPPNGTYLAGYGKDRTSTGQHDPLFAKAIFVSDAAQSLALVTLDNIGLTRPDIARIASAAAAAIPGLSADAVLVSSTHTHAGPDVVGLWGPNFWRTGRDEAYIDRLVQQAAQAIVEAHSTSQAATVRAGFSQLPLNWVKNLSEPQLLDSQLSVLQFQNDDGQNIATLTNYACHPTVLGPENRLVSADYLSGFYQAMASAIPQGQHLFLQGAIGGWVQPLQGNRGIELARQYGVELAQHSRQLLLRSKQQPSLPLIHLSKAYSVPLDNWGFRLMLWIGLLPQQLVDGALQATTKILRIGNSYFVTHPGETSPAYALESRSLLPGPNSFILGLTQGAMGYILKPAYFSEPTTYPHAEYLASVSVGEEAGPRLMAAIKTLTKELAQENPAVQSKQQTHANNIAQ